MMENNIKILRNNRKVIFGTGTFDDWCVYVVEKDGAKKAPHDVTYFSELLDISQHYGNNKVYQDFVSIYNLTTERIDQQAINLIDRIVQSYQIQHQMILEQWFTVIYAGMVAEENKAHAVLKKRIKRLGMYQVLILGITPTDAANFAKNKKWRGIDAIMKTYGF